MNFKKQLKFSLWTFKYQPQIVSHMVLPARLKTFFLNVVKEGEIPNLLLYSSSPGVGKSTIAKALCEEINAEYLYINISKDRGIDTLRSRIDKFASVMTLDNKKKIVIMDEFDGATIELQKAMRASIEEFQDYCRFIFTCNYYTQIKDPIKSRCQEIDFNFSNEEIQKEMKPKIVQRLKGILKSEKIEFDDEIIELLVDKKYPDIRKMIQLLQDYSKQYGIINKEILKTKKIDEEFYQLILNKKLTAARKYIIEKSYNYDEMYRELFDNLIPILPNKSKGQAILLIAEYMYRNNFVIDKEINFTACMLEIIGVL